MSVSAIAGSSANGTVRNPKSDLTSSDFVQLLVTQLQNQDPTQPMTNADMLQQVSQIGSLQSQESLTGALTAMTLQNQISSASSMIGKSVEGIDENGLDQAGTVTSLKVVDKAVQLQLDTGMSLPLGNVSDVKAAPVAAVSGTH